MEDDGHIFICDPPPGGKYILTVPGNLSREQIERIQEMWNEAMSNPKTNVIILQEGMIVQYLPCSPSWPDAEFCAA
jgi:hypothetical protein